MGFLCHANPPPSRTFPPPSSTAAPSQEGTKFSYPFLSVRMGPLIPSWEGAAVELGGGCVRLGGESVGVPHNLGHLLGRVNFSAFTCFACGLVAPYTLRTYFFTSAARATRPVSG